MRSGGGVLLSDLAAVDVTDRVDLPSWDEVFFCIRYQTPPDRVLFHNGRDERPDLTLVVLGLSCSSSWFRVTAQDSEALGDSREPLLLFKGDKTVVVALTNIDRRKSSEDFVLRRAGGCNSSDVSCPRAMVSSISGILTLSLPLASYGRSP